MSVYADTADLKELEEMLSLGIFSGVTTNQKILLKANPLDYITHIRKICAMTEGSVSVELTGSTKDYEALFQEGLDYSHISDKIVIKVPMWRDGTGVALANDFNKKGVKVNMTALMNVNQAIAGCLSNATYVSLFYNRMIDHYGNITEEQRKAKTVTRDQADLGRHIACGVIQGVRSLIDRYGWKSKIICGSIRTPEDIGVCLMSGADIVTVPYGIYKQMFYNEMTEKTIAEFDEAWRQYKK